MPNGGGKTGINYISAYRQVSNEIPTAVPVQQWFSIQMGLTTIVYVLIGSANYKMVAAKLEVSLFRFVSQTSYFNV